MGNGDKKEEASPQKNNKVLVEPVTIYRSKGISEEFLLVLLLIFLTS